MANWTRCTANDPGFSETYIAYIGAEFAWVGHNIALGKWGIARIGDNPLWRRELMVYDAKETAQIAAEMMYG